MNFILISPAFPNNFKPFAYELKKKGINVLGIGDTPYNELGTELQDALTEYYLVEDMEDIDTVKRAVAYLYFKHGKIERIESHNEFWLELDAELREEFNVPGVKPDDLKQTKFKSEMKKVFKRAGVPVVDGLVIEHRDELDEAIHQLGLPVVAKPDNGVGSEATFMIETPEELQAFKEYYVDKAPYFIEQAIASDRLGTYDGLIDQNGNIVWHTCLTYSKPTLEFIDQQADMAYVIQKDIDPKLVEYGKRIVKEFGMKERFFHIEFFKMPDGEYIALEYNNRIAGNYAVDLYNFAQSINLFSLYADVVLDHDIEDSTGERIFCVGITQRDKYEYQHSREQILAEFGDQIKKNERMPEAFAALMGDYFYAINAKTQDEVDDIIKFIHTRKQ